MLRNQDVVAQILSLARGGQPHATREFLSKLGDKTLAVDKRAAYDGLQTLDFKQHSACCLFLIDALANDDNVDDVFIQQACHFLYNCSLDVRKYAKRFNRLCTKLQEQTYKSNQPMRAIGPLFSAIGKLTDSSDTITPIHPLLFQSCLLAECLSAALPYLTPQTCEIDPPKTKLTIRDYLLYCYYGARVLIARRQYSRALDLLLQALTAPTMVVNAITMAAYKKYVLVSLIHKGSVAELPRFTPNAVHKGIRAQCSAYTALVNDFPQKAGAFRLETNDHRKKILDDGNGSLLDLALQQTTKTEIHQLTETYLTLPIQQISQTIRQTPAETELVLLRMIENREIQAKIDDSLGLVSFKEDTSDVELAAMAQRIQAQLQEAMQLSAKVKAMDNQVSCEKAYVSRTEPSPGPA